MAEFTPFIGALNGVKNAIVYVFELTTVTSETTNVVKTLEIVQRDLNRLRKDSSEKWKVLSEDDQKEILQTISDVNEAILQMAKPVKASWRNFDKRGTVTLYRRIQWTLSDKATASRQQNRLNVAHNSLIGMRNYLRTVNAQPNGRQQQSSSEFDHTDEASSLPQATDVHISEDVLKDRNFWYLFASSSASVLPASGMYVTTVETDSDEEEQAQNDPSQISPSGNTALLTPQLATRKRKTQEQGKKANNYNKKSKRESRSPSGSSIWDEISERDRDDSSRRSLSHSQDNTPYKDFWAELNDRDQEDLRRRRQA